MYDLSSLHLSTSIASVTSGSVDFVSQQCDHTFLDDPGLKYCEISLVCPVSSVAILQCLYLLLRLRLGFIWLSI